MTKDDFEQLKSQAEEQYPEKRMDVAYALLIILGTFGAHRFYLGKIKTGFLYIFLIIWAVSMAYLPDFFFPDNVSTALYFSSIIASICLNIWLLFDIFFVYKTIQNHNTQAKHQQLAFLEKMENDS